MKKQDRMAAFQMDNSGANLILPSYGDGIKHATYIRIWIEKRFADSIDDVRTLRDVN